MLAHADFYCVASDVLLTNMELTTGGRAAGTGELSEWRHDFCWT